MAMSINKREFAKRVLQDRGLPTKKIEKWHYTNLASMLSNYNINSASASDIFVKNISFKNADLDEIYEDFADPVLFLENDAIKQINIASLDKAINIDIVGENQDIIKLDNKILADQGNNSVAINMNASSKAVILENYSFGKASFFSHITNLYLCEKSYLKYIILHDGDLDIKELQQLNFILEADAKLDLYLINVNTKASLRRQEINGLLNGENSDFQLRSINLLEAAAHLDIFMDLKHNCQNTSSSEIVRNVLLDKSFGAFQGIIRVSQVAQKTEARMNCNSLLLSDNCSFSAKPELEIFADDVICGHGATISSVDENAMFYLTSRGIEEKLARAILTKAFVIELLDKDSQVKELLLHTIENWIINHSNE